jgi:hypothetical protein
MASVPNSSPRPPYPSPDAGRGRVLALAAAAQLAGVAIAACFALALPLAPLGAAVLAGAAAALMGRLLRLPRWWRAIHFLLPVLACCGLSLAIAPGWYLAAFAALLLLFGPTMQTSVPLYLSGRRELESLASLIPEGAAVRVLDAGCGIGSALAALHAQRPAARLEGVESAILPWLAARLRAAWWPERFRVVLGSLWRRDFGGYDVVYAFLSPVPMARLWRKARAEMRPGSLLVSNRFAVPGRPPAVTLDTGDGRCLYAWRM